LDAVIRVRVFSILLLRSTRLQVSHEVEAILMLGAIKQSDTSAHSMPDAIWGRIP
jgi:hypothetical protein